MKIKSAAIVITGLLVVFASCALLGGALQKAEDASVSTSDQGFVPSTGQINPGYTRKLPSSAIARVIPSEAEALAAFTASERATSAFDHDATTGAASSEDSAVAPIGASPQTTPSKFSATNDTLDRVPTMAWPLGLSDQQRQRIYQAVMADKTTPAADVGNLTLTGELPTPVALSQMHALPSSIEDIARVSGLNYVKSMDKVFLVAPANRIVVDEISG